MASRIVSIARLREALSNKKTVMVRPALENETPDFIQERDKLTTGGVVLGKGNAYCYEFDPPVHLRAGVGYVIVTLGKLSHGAKERRQ